MSDNDYSTSVIRGVRPAEIAEDLWYSISSYIRYELVHDLLYNAEIDNPPAGITRECWDTLSYDVQKEILRLLDLDKKPDGIDMDFWLQLSPSTREAILGDMHSKKFFEEYGGPTPECRPEGFSAEIWNLCDPSLQDDIIHLQHLREIKVKLRRFNLLHYQYSGGTQEAWESYSHDRRVEEVDLFLSLESQSGAFFEHIDQTEEVLEQDYPKFEFSLLEFRQQARHIAGSFDYQAAPYYDYEVPDTLDDTESRYRAWVYAKAYPTTNMATINSALKEYSRHGFLGDITLDQINVDAPFKNSDSNYCLNLILDTIESDSTCTFVNKESYRMPELYFLSMNSFPSGPAQWKRIFELIQDRHLRVQIYGFNEFFFKDERFVDLFNQFLGFFGENAYRGMSRSHRGRPYIEDSSRLARFRMEYYDRIGQKGVVQEAMKAFGVTRSTIYRWKLYIDKNDFQCDPSALTGNDSSTAESQ